MEQNSTKESLLKSDYDLKMNIAVFIPNNSFFLKKAFFCIRLFSGEEYLTRFRVYENPYGNLKYNGRGLFCVRIFIYLGS